MPHGIKATKIEDLAARVRRVRFLLTVAKFWESLDRVERVEHEPFGLEG